MALARQNIEISLAGGLDTKTDKYHVRGDLLLLENAVQTSPQSLQKRNGHTTLPQTVFKPTMSFDVVPGLVSTGNTLATLGNERVLLDGFSLFSFSAAANGWSWKGNATLCALSTAPKSQALSSRSDVDSMVFGGYEFVAFVDVASANLVFSVFDSASGALLYTLPYFAGATQPRFATLAGVPVCIFVYGNFLYITSFGGTVLPYPGASPNVASQIATDVRLVSSIASFDAVTLSNGHLTVAYNSTANTNNQITFLQFTTVGLSSITVAATFSTASNADFAITVWADASAQTHFARQGSTGNVAYGVLNAAFNALNFTQVVVEHPGATIAHITGVFDSFRNSSFVFYDFLGAGVGSNFPNAFIRMAMVSPSGSVSNVGSFLRSVSLASKVWLVASAGGNVPHLVAAHDSTLQPCYVLANLYNTLSTALFAGTVSGRLDAGAGASITRTSAPASAFAVGAVRRAAIRQVLDIQATLAVTVLALDFSASNFPAAEAANSLLIAGSHLAMYDGENVVEHGFYLFPENVTVSMAGSSGGLSAGLYGYQVIYSWVDAQGRAHRSAPSVTASATASATNTGTVTVPMLRLTNKINVVIEIYRTTANGSVFYLDGTVANNPTIDSVAYSSTVSDSTIQSRTQIYTTGGELENIVAPAAKALSIYKTRLVLIPSDDPNSWWFSKEVLPGSPLEFSDSFVENLPTEGGSATAIAQMDSNLIIFKASSIFYVQGDGPSSTGLNNDFGSALEIATDCGCVNPQSVVLTSMGLMFKSLKGLYLLSRGLALEYIGAKVEADNGTAIVSATLISVTTQVRFGLAGGSFIVFDYLAKTWGHFTGISTVSSVIDPITEYMMFVDSAGLVWVETPGVYNDNHTPYAVRAKLEWVQLAGIQGFQRVRRLLILGSSAGGSGLNAKVGYDFVDDSGQSSTVTISGTPDQWRIDLSRQKCEAIQLDLTEVPAGSGNAFALSSLVLECGLKRGTNKLPATKQTG